MILRIITIEEVKETLRIEGDQQDALIYRNSVAAEATVLNLVERTIEDLEQEYGEVPEPIRWACIALSAHLYEHPSPTEQVALYNVPYSIDAMIKPYIRYNHGRIHGGSSSR